MILEILDIGFLIFPYDPGNTGGGRAAPPARFSWLGLVLEHCSWKSVTALENKYYFTIFKIWLRRPNHYVQQTRIAILCRMAASMSNCLWSEVKFFRKTWKCTFVAMMSILPLSGTPSWTVQSFGSNLGRGPARVGVVRSATRLNPSWVLAEFV